MREREYQRERERVHHRASESITEGSSESIRERALVHIREWEHLKTSERASESIKRVSESIIESLSEKAS